MFFLILIYILPDSDEEVEPEPSKNELQNMVKTLTAKLEDMNTCNDLIAKHGSGLQRALTELESMDSPSEAGSKLKVINERATMFRITTNAMINVSFPVSQWLWYSNMITLCKYVVITVYSYSPHSVTSIIYYKEDYRENLMWSSYCDK